MYPIQRYTDEYADELLYFLGNCLPESGRKLDLNGKHKMYLNVSQNFEAFWIMLDGKEVIGTAALKKMYLDTLSSSTRAITLYEKAGFVITERYNANRDADIFMVLEISSL